MLKYIVVGGVNGVGKSTLYASEPNMWKIPRVNTDDIAKERVEKRVSMGGYGIPIKDIEKRYEESFCNLKTVLNLCDLAVFYDNTENFRRFAIFRNGKIARLSHKVPVWFEERNFI